MHERLPLQSDEFEPKAYSSTISDDVGTTVADIAYRHVRLICIGLVAGFALSALYVLATKPSYTAHVQVLIDVLTPQTLPQRQGEIPVAIDTAQIESQLAILRSDNLAGTVVDNLNLSQDREFIAGTSSLPGIFWRAPATAPPLDEARRRAVLSLLDSLEVRRQGVSFAIDIFVRSHDPAKAARIANGIADAYVFDQLSTRAKAAREGSEWLEERIDLLRRYMNKAALRVQEFKARRDYRIGKGDRQAGQVQADDPVRAAEGSMLEELESTATTYRRMYESFLQAYTDSVQRQSYPISNARVITPASRPLNKSHPKTILALAIGSLLGVLLGFSAAVVRQCFDYGRSRSARSASSASVGCRECRVRCSRV
jgi:uncharacterized protein involved in exopolysaccharide biosynthesis